MSSLLDAVEGTELYIEHCKRTKVFWCYHLNDGYIEHCNRNKCFGVTVPVTEEHSISGYWCSTGLQGAGRWSATVPLMS